MENNCPVLCKITKILVIIGALNWGLVGALNVNLVTKLVGAWQMAERGVYVLVGLAGVMMLVSLAKGCKSCSSGGGNSGSSCCSGSSH